MNTPRAPRRNVAGLLLAAAVLIAWAPSAAASVADFFNTYKSIEEKAPPHSLPVSSHELEAYIDLFTCVEQGGDAVACSATFEKSAAGQKVTGDIPEAVWQVVSAYLAWKDGNVWGVVSSLGEAAMCAVLQVLAGGFDACGLIKELIEVGKAFLDAGKAVAEFFKDLGSGAAKALKGAYCATVGSVLGGCDDEGPPPKPKSAVIYEKFFAPKVLPDGLNAIEAVDPFALHNLKNQIGNQAKAKGYSSSDVALASAMFDKAVDKQWTAHIVGSVLTELAAERTNYNTAGRISLASDYAWNVYKKEWEKYDKGLGWPDTQSYPNKKVPPFCVQRFVTLGYGHVDRWIQSHNEAKALAVMSNYDWCEKVFWEGNKAKFVPYFRKHVDTRCPGLLCASKGDLTLCDSFMATVGLKCALKLHSETGPVKAAPGALAALARPALSVASVRVQIERNCQAPEPALTASVAIRNAGGGLAAGKGTVFLEEEGGTNLSSAGIPLPAIAPGETKTVGVPAITLQSYSTLEGSHRIHVSLKPQSERGQLSFIAPRGEYAFTATFPPGHCKPAQRARP
jgi:hypothetical protein